MKIKIYPPPLTFFFHVELLGCCRYMHTGLFIWVIAVKSHVNICFCRVHKKPLKIKSSSNVSCFCTENKVCSGLCMIIAAIYWVEYIRLASSCVSWVPLHGELTKLLFWFGQQQLISLEPKILCSLLKAAC